MVLSRGNREGVFSSPYFPPPFSRPPFISAVSTDLPPLETSASPTPSPAPPGLWCPTPSGPPLLPLLLGLIVWLKQDPQDGTDGLRPGPGGVGGGGEAEPASAGKGEQFWENKHEGGAWEKVAGRGRLRALLRGARAGMEWGGPWGGPQGWAPVLKAGSNAGWLRRSGLTSPPRWPPG